MQPTFDFFSSIPWFAWIAIVAIVSGAISTCFANWLKHRERIEMIRQGMHPDAPELAKSHVPEL